MVSARSAGAVTIAGQLAKTVLQFAGLLIFSRILSPRDIGLVAMLAVFVMLGELIRDFGISQAAIQASNLTHRQASNLFWTNAAIGALMTIGLSFAAPMVAGMYHEPALTAITPWSALLFIISALQMQFQVHLARGHRFAALTATDVLSQLLGLIIGLTAALSGAGYWSLVIQMLSAAVSLLVSRCIIAGWWPALPNRDPGMATLYKFGAHLGCAQLLNYGALNTDSYVIGIRWGAIPLGVYNRAFQILTVPTNQLLAPLTNVVLPILSRKRHEGIDFYPALWKAQIVLSSTLTLLFALAGSLAEPLVRVMFGRAWLGSAPLLTILSVGGAFQIFTFVAYWAFLASGNAKQLFHQSLLIKPSQVACVVLGSFSGLEGVAWGFSIGVILSWFISLSWLRTCDDMPSHDFLRSGLHVLFCGAVTGVMTLKLVETLRNYSDLLVIAAGGALALLVYVPLLIANPPIRNVLVETIRPPITRLASMVKSRADH